MVVQGVTIIRYVLQLGYSVLLPPTYYIRGLVDTTDWRLGSFLEVRGS